LLDLYGCIFYLFWCISWIK